MNPVSTLPDYVLHEKSLSKSLGFRVSALPHWVLWRGILHDEMVLWLCGFTHRENIWITGKERTHLQSNDFIQYLWLPMNCTKYDNKQISWENWLNFGSLSITCAFWISFNNVDQMHKLLDISAINVNSHNWCQTKSRLCDKCLS